VENMTESFEELSKAEEKREQPCVERPLFHRILAWLLVAVVLFGFLGTCHWLATYGR